MGTISTMLWCGIAFWRGASHFLHGFYWWFGGFDGSGDDNDEGSPAVDFEEEEGLKVCG